MTLHILMKQFLNVVVHVMHFSFYPSFNKSIQPDLMRKQLFYEVAISYEYEQCFSNRNIIFRKNVTPLKCKRQ